MVSLLQSIDPLKATVTELRKNLESELLTSEDLVALYTAQIGRHNGYLKAVYSLVDGDLIQKRARQLDKERSEGKSRGPLHGIPILIKDNIGTDETYGLDTTAGSFALVGAKSEKSADVVHRLELAGAIIFGKTTLSELAYWKGVGLSCGWAANSGQSQSAYVRGGVDPDDTFGGHSNPGGSSSGSAISVSAGFAPITIGTETIGSLVMPANRASIYAIKPTIGLTSNRGIVPFHPQFDTPGPMAKNPIDVALAFDAMVQVESEPRTSKYEEAAQNTSWKEFRIGMLDPEIWRQPPTMIKPNEGATAQMIRDINAAYDRISPFAAKVQRNLTWIKPSQCSVAGSMLVPVWKHGFQPAFNDYVASLKETPVRNLEQLIQFNIDHATQELPSDNPNQDALLASLHPPINDEEAEETIKKIRTIGREEGIDQALSQYGIDVILAPADSPFTHMAALSGYPIVTLPLSYLEFNGRAFGVVAMAGKHQEETLFKVMGAWEATLHPRQPPPMLVNSRSDSTIYHSSN